MRTIAYYAGFPPSPRLSIWLVLVALLLGCASGSALAQPERLNKMFRKQMMGCRLLHVAVLQGEWPRNKPQQPEIREQEATDFPQWFAEHATRTYDGDVDLTDYNVGLALTSITIEGVPRLEDATIYHCSHPSFARAAIEALQHWRFSPLKVDGELREVMVFTDFVFALRW